MKTHLHKLPEGFIITSDEQVKEDDIALIPGYAGFVIVGEIDDMPYSELHRNWQGLNCDTCFDVEAVSKFTKVIAQQNQIDFSSLSEEEQKEIGWFDVEKLALKEFMFPEKLFHSMKNSSQNEYLLEEEYGKQNTVIYFQCIAFIKAFQKAQELLSDRRFTNKDLFNLMELLRNTESRMMFEVETRKYIESLSQPKSWEVEIEMNTWFKNNYDGQIVPTTQKLINGKIKILRIL